MGIHLQDPFENKPTGTPMTMVAESIEKNLTQMYQLYATTVVKPSHVAVWNEQYKDGRANQTNGQSIADRHTFLFNDECDTACRQRKDAVYYVLRAIGGPDIVCRRSTARAKDGRTRCKD